MTIEAVPGTVDFSSAALKRMETLEARIGAVLAEKNYSRIEPPILELAEPFLETSGEDIRRRLYSFADPAGVELCLRPDLTIPACRLYLRDSALKARAEARLLVIGPAFRHQPEGRLRQFRQIDAELLNAPDRNEADAEILSVAHLALRAAGLAEPEIRMGDLGLFYDLANHLDVPPRFQAKLHRALGRPDALERLLSNGTKKSAGSALIAALGKVGPDSARQMIEEILALAQIPAVGGRSIDEIAARFIAKANDAASPPLSDSAAAAIRDFLSISGSPQTVAKELERRFGRIGLNLDLFNRRLELIAKAGIGPEKIHFACGFARRIDYYTGLVFEMNAAGGDPTSPVLAGGRYDGLLKRLGADRNIPAIGFALWPERLKAS